MILHCSKRQLTKVSKHTTKRCGPGLNLYEVKPGEFELRCFSRNHGGRNVLITKFAAEITQK